MTDVETRQTVLRIRWSAAAFSYGLPGGATCMLGGRQGDLPAAEGVVLLHTFLFSEDE